MGKLALSYEQIEFVIRANWSKIEFVIRVCHTSKLALSYEQTFVFKFSLSINSLVITNICKKLLTFVKTRAN